MGWSCAHIAVVYPVVSEILWTGSATCGSPPSARAARAPVLSLSLLLARGPPSPGERRPPLLPLERNIFAHHSFFTRALSCHVRSFSCGRSNVFVLATAAPIFGWIRSSAAMLVGELASPIHLRSRFGAQRLSFVVVRYLSLGWCVRCVVSAAQAIRTLSESSEMYGGGDRPAARQRTLGGPSIR